MNKKIIVAGLAVVVLGGAYTSFWVYESGKIKSSIEQMAGLISKEIGKKNTEFFYTSSQVSGFPFGFTVNINQPKFVSTGGGEKIELSSAEENLIIKTNLVGSSYRINLPTKIDIKYTADEKEKNYKLEFTKTSPEIELKFLNNVLFTAKDVPTIIPYLSDNLKSLSYTDSGYALTGSEDGAKLASSDSESVQVTKVKSKPNTISTSYNIKMQNVDHSGIFSDADKATAAAAAAAATPASIPADATVPAITPATTAAGLWPISANLDVSSVDTRDESGKSTSVEFAVNDLDITAATFGVGIKGNIKADGEDIFPFGDLSIKARSYQNMVDYFSGMVSNAFAQTNIPIFHIKSEKSIDFKKVLYEVSSEKSNEDKDILLTLNREKGKSLFIGQKGLMEVIDLLKSSTTGAGDELKKNDATNTEPKKSDAAVVPMPKLIDAAPSSGVPVELQPTNK